MSLKGASAAIADAAAAAGPVAGSARPVQARLPLADASAVVAELERQPLRSQAVAEARRRGRPKGSRNRRSEELIRFVLARHAHPLLVLAQTYSRPVEALAAELDCTALEAISLQVRCAAEALPYFESKKPVALQVDARVIQLVVAEHAGERSQQLPPWEQIGGPVIDGQAADEGAE